MSRADEIERQLIFVTIGVAREARRLGLDINLWAISDVIERAVEQAHKQQQEFA